MGERMPEGIHRYLNNFPNRGGAIHSQSSSTESDCGRQFATASGAVAKCKGANAKALSRNTSACADSGRNYDHRAFAAEFVQRYRGARPTL